MIRYALSCDRGHEFDAWFGSISSYDEQVEAHAITCPSCGSTHVRKSPMAPAVKKRKAEPVAVREDGEHRRTYAFLKDLKAHLKANPFDIKPAFIATKTTSALLPETILGRPSKAPGETPVAV